MAKIPVKRIEIAGTLAQRDALLRYLQRKGAVEVRPTDAPDETRLTRPDAAADAGAFARKGMTLDNACELLEKYGGKKAGLLASLTDSRTILTQAQFDAPQISDDEAVEAAEAALADEKAIAENAAARVRLQTAIAKLAPWMALDIPTDTVRAGAAAVLIGSFPRALTLETLYASAAENLLETDAFDAEILSSSPELTCVCVFCAVSEREQTERALRAAGFSRLQDVSGRTPREEKRALEEEIARLDGEDERLKAHLKTLSQQLPALYLARDRMQAFADEADALGDTLSGAETFFLSGYVPADKGAALCRSIEEKFDASAALAEPAPDEDVPVALKNRGFARPLEWITEMYSLPGKTDVDPTPVMAFFYYFFFGMMLSDAGYGLLIVIATGIVLWKLKPAEEMRNKVKMIFFCGLSTVFWGAVYGSWFGDLPAVIARDFMGLEDFKIKMLIDPLTELMRVMVICFIFGLVHLFTGVGVGAVNAWRQGRKLDAFCDSVPIYVCVLGLAPIFFNLFTDIPAWMSKAGTPVLILGVVLVVATQGRSSKSIGGKIGGGLYALYNLVSGYLGDVLSYARLLALGLATGVIAQVINMLGTLPGSKPLKAVMLIVVGLVGHIANLFINVIGAYVHTNRLQFVEFFSKFYEGGGRALEPFRIKSEKYSVREDH